MSKTTTDVAIIGAGHNGLVAAVFLARHGLSVTVFEEKAVIGGAAKTEYPFPKAPKLGTSSGAYLLGVMQPELIAKLGARFKLIRRDPTISCRRPTNATYCSAPMWLRCVNNF